MFAFLIPQHTRSKLLSLTKQTEQLSKSDADRVTEVISVAEREWNHTKPEDQGTTTIHRWLCFRERVRADESHGFEVSETRATNNLFASYYFENLVLA